MDPLFRELFTFTSGEKKGLLVLSGLMVLLFAIHLLLPYLTKESENSRSDWISLMSKIDLNEHGVPDLLIDSVIPENDISTEKELLQFNPNTATAKDFLDLGLTGWQINIIEKYRKKGGIFRKTDDFSKLYGISKVQFEKLKPYISISLPQFSSKSDSEHTFPTHYKSAYKLENLMLEINSCDSFQLEKLQGIGKSLSSRIIKYRDKLGGFVKLEQLLEIYGFRPETYRSIIPHIKLDTMLIIRIKINSIEYSLLRRHPYMNPFEAKSIIKYRELRGKIGEGDLEKNNLLSKETFSKIKSYISYE